MNLDMNSPEAGFTMRDAYRSFMLNWPWIVAFALLGGLGGFVVSLLRPPLYRAENTVSVSISYAASTPLDLVVEDRVLDRVASLMWADATLAPVLSQIPPEWAEARGWKTAADLRADLRLDRRLSEWGMVMIDGDPEIAARVADLWAAESLEVVGDALEHAMKVAQMVSTASRRNFDPVGIDVDWYGKPLWECQILPPDIDPALLDGAFQEELRKSRGLFPSLVVEDMQQAQVPDKPIIWGRGILIFAGAWVGFFAGVAFLLMGISHREGR
jgi:hypothetical protein